MTENFAHFGLPVDARRGPVQSELRRDEHPRMGPGRTAASRTSGRNRERGEHAQELANQPHFLDPPMQLPQTVEYALRAMAYIANLPPNASVRAHDLAAATNVPPHYLSKLMRRLVVAGLLKSQKGHHGGFVLALPPRYIRALDIMVAADYRPDPSHCAFGWGHCKPEAPCPLHPSWSKLNEAICTWAAMTTLADMLVEGGLPMPSELAAAAAATGDAQVMRDPRGLLDEKLKKPRRVALKALSIAGQ